MNYKNSDFLYPPNSSFSEDKNTVSSPSSSVFDLPLGSYNPPLSSQHKTIENNNITTTPDVYYLEPIRSSLLVISGGTGANSLCAAFGSDACYVLPVSDDGGSSSEIIRVIGGPSVGDIRSRLIRLIPTTPPDSPLHAIRALLSHRLPSDVSDAKAREEWRNIVEGSHPLWKGIPSDKKEAIRGFLVHFESEVLRRAHKGFSFRNGSVGNYFLAGTRDFMRSLPAAIFLFSAITQSQANILPVLTTNHTVTIAAELENHSTIIGQCNISHPMVSSHHDTQLTVETDSLDSDRLLPSRNVSFSKSPTSNLSYEPLSSPISRVYYINSYGHEIQPWPNAEYLTQLNKREILIYSCGSLWTSIMPCIALQGLGQAIAGSKTLKAKVLLLNSFNDRETHGYTAENYISAIERTLRRPYCNNNSRNTVLSTDSYPVSAFITHLVYIKDSEIQVDVRKIQKLGIKCIEITGKDRNRQFTAQVVHGILVDIQSEIDREKQNI